MSTASQHTSRSEASQGESSCHHATRDLAFACYRRLRAAASHSPLRRFVFLHRADEHIHSLLHPPVAIVHSHRMHLDPHDDLKLATSGLHEPAATRFFMELISPGDVILDLGAHIGYFTLLFAKLAGEAGRVIAFEPDPDSFAILQRNVAENRYGNVVLVNKAVGDRVGRVRLYKVWRSPHSSIIDPRRDCPWVDVDAISLDQYFRNDERPIDVVKMDIEGAEPKAFRGMTRVLERSRKMTIVTEILAARVRENETREFIQGLAAQGFRLHLLNEETCRLERLRIPTLLSGSPHLWTGHAAATLVATRS